MQAVLRALRPPLCRSSLVLHRSFVRLDVSTLRSCRPTATSHKSIDHQSVNSNEMHSGIQRNMTPSLFEQALAECSDSEYAVSY